MKSSIVAAQIYKAFLSITFSTYLVLFATKAEGQFTDSKMLAGFSIGYADQTFVNVDYTYRAILFQGQFSWALARRKKWRLEALAQPQFNTTHFDGIPNGDEQISGWETGINLGLLYRRSSSDKPYSYYALLSAGPHYIQGSLDRQSEGFIFSDNLALGATYDLGKGHIDIRIGIRHLSNAGLKQPNGGINNTVFNLGYLVAIGQ